jgi:ankyrin repeat protein
MTFRKTLLALTIFPALTLSTTAGYSAADLEQPASIVRPLKRQLTPEQRALIHAVKDGDLSTVKTFINVDGIDKNTQDLEDGNSLLHLAIQGQKRNIFDFLLKINCDVGIQNAYGETPMHEAASGGYKDMLDLLLQEDTVRVNAQDKDGNTAFHVSVLKKHLDCATSIKESKAFEYATRNKKGLTVMDLLDQQGQGSKGQGDLAQVFKIGILRDYNVTVLGILEKEAPITPAIQRLATDIVQQNKKLFISYCWSKEYSTVPMVNDFENFIKHLGITNYYRDVREEEGLGMTRGTNIEDFMKHAKESDVVVIFLNEAYLRSRNCMYEFLQVWDANNKKISQRAFIIRHPNFTGLFSGADAAIPYTQHWKGEFQRLRSENIDPAHAKRHLKEEEFMGEVANHMTPIINELSTHIQVDYQQMRSKGFIDIFKLALGGKTWGAEEKEEPGVPGGPDASQANSPQQVAHANQHAPIKMVKKKVEVAEDEEKGAQVGSAIAPAIPIPLIAEGFEAIYQRFFSGVLVYQPEPGNDAGRINMPIAALANPLEGTFDLSQCGDAAKYLSISTGYRKAVKPENANKTEIWLAPRFLIEKELATTARHFNDLIATWRVEAPIGFFWSWGGWDNMSWFDYLTTESLESLGTENLYEKWKKSEMWRSKRGGLGLRRTGGDKPMAKNFNFIFAELKC